jgi:hypothetical protein
MTFQHHHTITLENAHRSKTQQVRQPAFSPNKTQLHQNLMSSCIIMQQNKLPYYTANLWGRSGWQRSHQ